MSIVRPSILAASFLTLAAGCGGVPPSPESPMDAATPDAVTPDSMKTTASNTCFQLVDAGCLCSEPRVTRFEIDLTAVGTKIDQLSERMSIRLQAQMPEGTNYVAVFFKATIHGSVEDLDAGWIQPVTTTQYPVSVVNPSVGFGLLREFQGGQLEASVYAVSGSVPTFVGRDGTFVSRREVFNPRNCISQPAVRATTIPVLPDNNNPPSISSTGYIFGTPTQAPQVRISLFHEGPRIRGIEFGVDPLMEVGRTCDPIPTQSLTESADGAYSVSFTLNDPRCQLEHVNALVGSVRMVYESLEGGEGRTRWESFSIHRSGGDPSPMPLAECSSLRVPTNVVWDNSVNPYRLTVTTPPGTSLIQVSPVGNDSCSPTPFFTRDLVSMVDDAGVMSYTLFYQPEVSCSGSFSALSVRTFILGCDNFGNAEVPVR